METCLFAQCSDVVWVCPSRNASVILGGFSASPGQRTAQPASVHSSLPRVSKNIPVWIHFRRMPERHASMLLIRVRIACLCACVNARCAAFLTSAAVYTVLCSPLLSKLTRILLLFFVRLCTPVYVPSPFFLSSLFSRLFLVDRTRPPCPSSRSCTGCWASTATTPSRTRWRRGGAWPSSPTRSSWTCPGRPRCRRDKNRVLACLFL